MKTKKQLSEYLREFNSLILSTEKEYNECFKTVGDCDKATQDLLHQIELGAAKDRNRAATMLHNIRIERREAKDILNILEAFKGWIDRNAGAITGLRNAIGVTKTKERIAPRYYYPRIIEDLPIGSNNN